MAIAFDAAVNGGLVFPGTSLTWSHTCSGSDRILFVGVVGGTTDTVTGVTYDGVAMTLVNKCVAGADFYSYLFYLIAPSTGAHNVVISASSGLIIGLSSSYTGVSQTGQPDSSSTKISTVASATYTQSTTTVADNSWTIFHLRESTGRDATAGAGTVTRIEYGAAGAHICDSGGAITPAGSSSLNISNFQGVSPPSFAGVMASFKPAGAAPTFLPKIIMS